MLDSSRKWLINEIRGHHLRTRLLHMQKVIILIFLKQKGSELMETIRLKLETNTTCNKYRNKEVESSLVIAETENNKVPTNEQLDIFFFCEKCNFFVWQKIIFVYELLP